jgi:hypothetical protein
MPNAANKTQPTNASVQAYFDAIADEARRAECEALAAVMQRATKQPAVMWGTSIVGFGRYHYVYDSGREGDSCLVGFSSRKGEIALYVLADFPGLEALLAQLGKHRRGKGCLYLKRLADVDAKVLEKLVAASAQERKRRYPD